jgi:hypothetical protein
MSMILAIDPGTTESGFVLFDGTHVTESGVTPNRELLQWLRDPGWSAALAIEMVASYGMPVGREVFETCVWIGRFLQAWYAPEAVRLVYRREVKMHLCGKANAKDPNVRQALLDLFPSTGGGATPQIGTKGRPGPLYGVSTHAWAALGVAIVAMHQLGKLKVQTQGPLFDQPPTEETSDANAQSRNRGRRGVQRVLATADADPDPFS